ncbi:MAG TPA: hypothetical protein EYQ21_00055 [Flavobacteriales bacterium]|jgi:hypothetical protein|nr:hypothetical protein [Flavobacteriales bacterium]
MKNKILSFKEFTALTEGNDDLWFLDGVTKTEFNKIPTWKVATWSATAAAATEKKSIMELYEIEKKDK